MQKGGVWVDGPPYTYRIQVDRQPAFGARSGSYSIRSLPDFRVVYAARPLDPEFTINMNRSSPQKHNTTRGCCDGQGAAQFRTSTPLAHV